MAKPQFKFKSSGTKRGENKQFDTPQIIKQNIGIKTPLSYGKGKNELFEMHDNPVAQIKDNFRNLLLTNYGERLGRPEIGADLISLVFDGNDNQTFLRLADIKIKETVKKYMPFITINEIQFSNLSVPIQKINEFKSSSNSIGLRKIKLNINYNITQLQINNQIMEIVVFVGG